jgi:outer membrane protein OmpA-like peptidoglycan-associated protein
MTAPMTTPAHAPRRPRTFAPLLAVALLATSPALADDVEVAVDGKVMAGKGKPKLKLKVNKALVRATIKVSDGKGKHVDSRGPAKAGATVSFPLPHTRPGKRTWRGSLDVKFKDGATGSMPLQFQTHVDTLFSFETTSSPQEIQNEHKVTIKVDRACSKIEVEAYGETGELVASQGKEFDNAPAGTPLTVDWIPSREGPVLQLKVTVYDDSGTHRSGEFFPLLITIPHEEVVFETGKWDIRASEVSKLESALVEAKKVIGRYSKGVKVSGKRMRLFVSGHTDSVGSPGSNRKLSWNRARAIGAWFKRNGVGVTVYVRGFGEDHLKVPTPDETDEEQNRRVDYDVSINGPTGSTGGWDSL